MGLVVLKWCKCDIRLNSIIRVLTNRLDYVMRNYRHVISELATCSGIARGPLILAQKFIVPELLCLLICEDLVVSEEDARVILHETTVLGEILNSVTN